MTPSAAEQAFERWWKEAYEGSTLHDKETARTFWLAASTQGAREERKRCLLIHQQYCPCGIKGEEVLCEESAAIRHREEGRT